MRVDSAIKFPYQNYKGIFCPIIPIEINGFILDAYVDSGAFVSIFSSEQAEGLLKIDYQKGKQASMIVGDGTAIPVFYHLLPVVIGNISLKATIGFSPRLKIGFNLLGRKDIFERFKVIFDERKKAVNFIPYKLR